MTTQHQPFLARKRALIAMVAMRDKKSPLVSYIESFFLQKDFAAKSQRDYRRYLVDFDHFTGCGSLEDAMDLDKAAAWVSSLKKRGASCAHNGATYLKSFATWLSKNPSRAQPYLSMPGGVSALAGLESPKVPQTHRAAFTDEQMEAIWDALELFPQKDRARAKAYMSLGFATGMRKNEMRQLALRDIHMDGERSWVHVQATTSKGRKERRIRLDASVLGDIETYIQDARPTYCGPQNRPEPLFLTREGKPFTEYGFSTWADRIWDSIQRDTGIHGFSHLLRHTWATNFHRASGKTGTSVYDLKQQGGWADLNIPQRYTHERPMDEFLDLPTHISALRANRKARAS